MVPPLRRRVLAVQGRATGGRVRTLKGGMIVPLKGGMIVPLKGGMIVPLKGGMIVPLSGGTVRLRILGSKVNLGVLVTPLIPLAGPQGPALRTRT